MILEQLYLGDQTVLAQAQRERAGRFGLIVFLFMFCFLNVCIAEEATVLYTPQIYIDTTIERVYYNLNTAMEIAGSGFKQQDAIADAKRVAQRLRKLADRDANKKYILWKVGELESQIYLEETGLLREKKNAVLKDVNQLALEFNAETGKRRPDFVNLQRILDQTRALDPEKGDEIASLISDRIANISREVLYIVEAAIDDGDFDKAREELSYCKNNEGCLNISLTKYSLLAAKLQSKVSADNDKAFVLATNKKTEEQITRYSLAEAADNIRLIQMRLEAIKPLIAKPEWERFNNIATRLVHKLENKEDSLETCALALLKKEGVNVAQAYVDSTLKKYGMSPEKIGRINYTILSTAVAQKTGQNTRLSAEFTAISQAQSSDSGSVLDNLLATARKKAAAKSDSLKTVESRRVGVTHVESVRRERMAVAQAGMQQREEQRIKENKGKANQDLIELYTLIEQHKIKEAYAGFSRQQESLKKYLAAEAYDSLKTRVSR